MSCRPSKDTEQGLVSKNQISQSNEDITFITEPSHLLREELLDKQLLHPVQFQAMTLLCSLKNKTNKWKEEREILPLAGSLT